MGWIFSQFSSVNLLLQLLILVMGCPDLDACLIGPVANDSDSGCCYNFYKVNNICQECLAGYFGDKCGMKCIYPEYGKSCALKCDCSITQCHNEKGCSIIVQQVETFSAENTDERKLHTTKIVDSYTNKFKKVVENTTVLRIFVIYFGTIISSFLALWIVYELYIFYKMLKENGKVNINNNEENIYADNDQVP